MTKEVLKAFLLRANSGFQITLPNGVVVSTMFGYMHYGDNRNNQEEIGKYGLLSDAAEVAFFREEAGNWVTKEVAEIAGIDCGDDVIGWVSIDNWLKLLDAARTLKKEK